MIIQQLDVTFTGLKVLVLLALFVQSLLDSTATFLSIFSSTLLICKTNEAFNRYLIVKTTYVHELRNYLSYREELITTNSLSMDTGKKKQKAKVIRYSTAIDINYRSMIGTERPE